MSATTDEKSALPSEVPATTDFADESTIAQSDKFMSEFMSLTMREQHFISSADKIAEKLTPEHITQIIAASAKEDSQSFTAFKWNSVIKTGVFVLSLAFAAFMLVFFRDSDHFTTILAAIFSFLGGLGVGRTIKGGGQ